MILVWISFFGLASEIWVGAQKGAKIELTDDDDDDD
jgi:hypothetical protein